jgi:HTH-type transcriptional regulator, competence development regulator
MAASDTDNHHAHFGAHVRKLRLARRVNNRSFSLRQVATRVGVQPGYLSRIETGDTAPPGEAVIKALACDLGENEDVLLALGGKVSAELKAVIVKRPGLFGQLLRQLADAPDHAVVRVVREVRDGQW